MSLAIRGTRKILKIISGSFPKILKKGWDFIWPCESALPLQLENTFGVQGKTPTVFKNFGGTPKKI